MYRVFLGAPPAASIDVEQSYHWQTVSSTAPAPTRASSSQWLGPPPSSRQSQFFYLPATLEAASKRISLIYKNAIFDQTTRDEDDVFEENETSQGLQRGEQDQWNPMQV